ncbi:MAG TPA: glycosyltransferase family 39 protein, partial [Candidatus Omnitrophota bacterium]|nr:glycosyltransferase family 39 protein [Candidatus Omnitrophota bacterium]
LTFFMLFWSWAGGNFSGIELRVFMSGITVGGALMALRYKHARFKKEYLLTRDIPIAPGHVPGRAEFLWELLDILIVVFLIFHCVYIFWRAFHIPVYGFDPLKINALNAKMFYFEKRIVFPLDPVYRGYPLHVSLLQAWMAINIGQWNDQVIKFFVPFYFASYLVIQYEFVKFLGNARQALWSLGLLLTANLFALHASLAYMDFPLMVYTCLTIIFLLLWWLEQEDRFLYLAAILGGMGTFVKREGLAYLVIYGILFVLMLIFRQGKGKHDAWFKTGMKFFLPSVTLAVIFPIFKFTHQVNSQGVLFNLSWCAFSRIPVILSQFFLNFFLSGNWSLVWGLLLLRLLFPSVQGSHPLFKWFITAIALFVGLIFFLFLLTNAFFWIAERDTTLSRLILHFFPLATMALVLRPFPCSGRAERRE